jgi:hypothetical protein
MKLIIFCLVIFSLTGFAARAQEKIVANFENVNPAAYWGWDADPVTAANPDKGGSNTSSQVLEWKKSQGTWKAFVISFDAVNVGSNPVVSFQFYSPVKGTISARIETGNEDETVYFDIDITETNKWVNYTTDLTPLLKATKSFTQASFFINPDKDADTSNYYWDDLKFEPKK